jgi:hypothetical protein
MFNHVRYIIVFWHCFLFLHPRVLPYQILHRYSWTFYQKSGPRLYLRGFNLLCYIWGKSPVHKSSQFPLVSRLMCPPYFSRIVLYIHTSPSCSLNCYIILVSFYFSSCLPYFACLHLWSHSYPSPWFVRKNVEAVVLFYVRRWSIEFRILGFDFTWED